MVIIETSVFTKLIKDLFSDDDYAELQNILVLHPEIGDLIPETAGLRKVRWKHKGRGKRGGTRIIYYWHALNDQIWMLYAYPKSRQDNLSKSQLKVLHDMINRWKYE